VDRDDLSVQAGPGSDLVVDPKPADKAAVSSIRVALIALGASAVGVWLAMLFGSILLLVLGLLAWLICWPIGVGLAVGALRNAWSSPTPDSLRRKAWLAIGISIFSIILVVTYVIALSVAINKIVGE
jgi:hypothetical protein